MKVAICDDENNITDMISKMCIKVLGSETNIIILNSESDFSNIDEIADLLLLDIDMPGRDGISIKNDLILNGSTTEIIYITNHEERMKDAFGKNVIGFIDKTDLENELPNFLHMVQHNLEDFLVLDNGICTKNIMYIESDGNYVKLYLTSMTHVMYRIKMHEIEQLLSDVGFVRIHRGIIVNLKFIENTSSQDVYIKGGIRLQISVRYKKSFSDIYKKYRRDHMHIL